MSSCRLRDSNVSITKSTGKRRRNRQRNARKELQDQYYRQNFPSFYVPAITYNIIYVHRFTHIDTMDILLKHIESCRSFVIDTESVGDVSNITLIQIHTIPRELPAYVIFIQLHHLPLHDSILFQKILLLFQYVLQGGNFIYCWRSSKIELERALSFGLFSFPLVCTCINLQDEFRTWYAWVPPFCKVCRPSDDYPIYPGSSMFCSCQDVPYRDPAKHWSLQNAVMLAFNSYLDKTQTINPWNAMIDPEYSSLSIADLEPMIRYALYDCLAVSCLYKPVMQIWNFEQLRRSPIHVLLTDPQVNLSPIRYEFISDDDEEVNNPLPPPIELELFPSSIISDVELNNNPPQKLPSHSSRSKPARRRRNKKRNNRRRFITGQYQVIRPIYRSYTITKVKRILHQLHIWYTGVKIRSNELIIITKNQELCHQCESQLPHNLFDRDHYYSIS